MFKVFLSALFLLLDANLIAAQSLTENKTHTTADERFSPVFTLSVGGFFSKLGQSNSFTPIDLCHYIYQPNQASSKNLLLGGFIGSRVKQYDAADLLFGIAYYQPNNLIAKGVLTQGADAISDSSYTYQYQIKSQQLLAESKLFWTLKNTFQPFIMLGVGAAFNSVSNYQSSVPPFLEFTPNFSNHRQVNFSYAIGPGIDFNLSPSFKIGAVYRFTDLGPANSGSAVIDNIWILNTLNQSHLYSNQILVQFTFVPYPRS